MHVVLHAITLAAMVVSVLALALSAFNLSMPILGTPGTIRYAIWYAECWLFWRIGLNKDRHGLHGPNDWSR